MSLLLMEHTSGKEGCERRIVCVQLLFELPK